MAEIERKTEGSVTKRHAFTAQNLSYSYKMSVTERLVTRLKAKNRDDRQRCLWSAPLLRMPAQGIQPLVGRNGSGKSTFLRVLLGHLKPDTGTLTWEQGFDQDSALAYLPEFPTQISGVTVKEWVAWYNGVPVRKVFSQAPALLDQAQFLITDIANRELQKLSKGQLQRAQLWQCLYGEPRMLVLDEPFSGLDPWHKESVVSLLSGFAKTSCILISTHELPQALRTQCEAPWIIDPETAVLEQRPFEEVSYL
jgi:ABC-type Mn2+/Zn2+ transport system ATPase subunit